jgi:hypothetical protein
VAPCKASLRHTADAACRSWTASGCLCVCVFGQQQRRQTLKSIAATCIVKNVCMVAFCSSKYAGIWLVAAMKRQGIPARCFCMHSSGVGLLASACVMLHVAVALVL